MERFLANLDDEKILDMLAVVSAELHEEHGDRKELMRERDQLLSEFRLRRLMLSPRDGEIKENGF